MTQYTTSYKQIGHAKFKKLHTAKQTKLQDAIARFDYEQTKPYTKLNQYLG